MLKSDADMIEGYHDGRDPESPVPSANQSSCYRHGFANGRDDLAGKPRASIYLCAAIVSALMIEPLFEAGRWVLAVFGLLVIAGGLYMAFVTGRRACRATDQHPFDQLGKRS